jgi:hypothetical protein
MKTKDILSADPQLQNYPFLKTILFYYSNTNWKSLNTFFLHFLKFYLVKN